MDLTCHFIVASIFVVVFRVLLCCFYVITTRGFMTTSFMPELAYIYVVARVFVGCCYVILWLLWFVAWVFPCRW